MKFTIDTDDAVRFAKKMAPGAVGAGVGAFLGSFIGIAALGTAIAGTVPVAVIGGTIGLLIRSHVSVA